MLSTLVLCFALLFTFSAAESIPDEFDVDTIDLDTITCPTLRCAPIGRPICARREHQLALFPTNCALLAFICVSGQDWEPVSLKKCARRICPVECNSSQATPVCASNGKKLKVFNSECEFRNYACLHYRQKWSRGLTCYIMHDIQSEN